MPMSQSGEANILIRMSRLDLQVQKHLDRIEKNLLL